MTDACDTVARREFIGNHGAAGLGLAAGIVPNFAVPEPDRNIRLGLIGLDSSHVIHFPHYHDSLKYLSFVRHTTTPTGVKNFCHLLTSISIGPVFCPVYGFPGIAIKIIEFDRIFHIVSPFDISVVRRPNRHVFAFRAK